MSEETTNVEETVQKTVEQQNEEQPQEEVQAVETPQNVTVDDDGTIKVDLRQQPQTEEANAVQEQETTSVDVGERTEDSPKVDQEVRSDNNESAAEEQTLELVQEETVEEKEPTLADKIKDLPNKLKEQDESVNNNQETNELPENIDKLVKFMMNYLREHRNISVSKDIRRNYKNRSLSFS